MSSNLELMYRNGHWVTQVQLPDGTWVFKGITFKLVIPGLIRLDDVRVPYNDRYGDDAEHWPEWVIVIGNVNYKIETHEEVIWSPGNRKETSCIDCISKDGESITDLVIPFDHPLYGCFQTYELGE